ncbi:MAG: DUF192 domain-containing protein [Bacillota bacterium]|nr:DUF192 domain-containing protein [Bacillota bacterium]
MRIKICCGNNTIADDVRVADNFFSRLVGLLSTPSMSDNQGLLIKRCRQVHCIGMRFAIDVVFINKENKIVAIESNLKPGHFSKYYSSAVNVLELNSGVSQKFELCPDMSLSFMDI